MHALSEETYMTSQTARDLIRIQKQMIGLWSPELFRNQDPPSLSRFCPHIELFVGSF